MPMGLMLSRENPEGPRDKEGIAGSMSPTSRDRTWCVNTTVKGPSMKMHCFVGVGAWILMTEDGSVWRRERPCPQTVQVLAYVITTGPKGTKVDD